MLACSQILHLCMSSWPAMYGLNDSTLFWNLVGIPSLEMNQLFLFFLQPVQNKITAGMESNMVWIDGNYTIYICLSTVLKYSSILVLLKICQVYIKFIKAYI